MKDNYKTGYLLAFSAAVIWGVSGTLAQFLFQHRGINTEWLVTVRLLLTGIIFLLFSGARKNPGLFKIWKNKTDIIQLLLFSIIGMMAVQYTYFAAIKYSNAATATVLQYLGPVVIAGYYAVKMKRLPVFYEIISVLLALSGTFLLVTHGSLQSLYISGWALFWGITSAITLAFYSIQPIMLLRKYDSSVVIGWSMLIGGIAFSFVHPPWRTAGVWDTRTYIFTAFIILMGSLVSFYAYLTAVKYIGAKTTSLLACAEPLSAAILAVYWLDISFGLYEWLGTACILVTIIILTIKDRPEAVNILV
jgi:drug/metabolite transporter (DMT)-like permease